MQPSAMTISTLLLYLSAQTPAKGESKKVGTNPHSTAYIMYVV